MITEQDRKSTIPHILTAVILSLLAVVSSSAIAASANIADPTNTWNLTIAFLVFAATAGSAVLNIAAIRNWDKNWGLVSGLPLLGLLIWGALIVVAKQLDANAHALWALEIFAWAMINLIYMVTAMTAKRMFAKRDGEDPTAP
ncbi:MAG: peptidoglycan/LPS O-acetylase OafA/YrhL [Pseudohongiellaceae bacterium]